MAVIKRITRLNEVGVRTLNEDAVLVNEESGVFGVFDGASSLTKYLSTDGLTGAYIASHTAAETFSNTEDRLDEVLHSADLNIDKVHKELGIDVSDAANRFSTTVAVVKIRKNKAELLQVGDSVIIVVYKDGRVETPLGYHDHDLEVMHKWRRLADEGRNNIRQLVDEDVFQLRRSGNIRYGTLNGDGRSKKFMKHTVLDVNEVSAIILITDGMLIPKADPDAEEDWDYYAQLYEQGGLANIFKTVRKLEDSDPQLSKYPRYKLHDDASGIAVEFS